MRVCPHCGAHEKGREPIYDTKWNKTGETPSAIEHKPDCADPTATSIDCYEWDALSAAGKRPTAGRPFGPNREGSRYCRSGSTASGGKREYCTCDTCF